jgi:SOS-response transcriptional repressor LexA
LAEIAEKLNCTPGDLITDRDEVKRLPAGWRFVPVISWARAGAQDFNYSDLEGQIDDTLISDVKDVNAYAIIVEGDSMEPRVTAGDRVVTMPNSEARNGDLVVARLEESGGVMVKYFKRTGPEGETVTLTSQNELYKAVSFPYGAFRFIHPVYEVRSKRR